MNKAKRAAQLDRLPTQPQSAKKPAKNTPAQVPDVIELPEVKDNAE